MLLKMRGDLWGECWGVFVLAPQLYLMTQKLYWSLPRDHVAAGPEFFLGSVLMRSLWCLGPHPALAWSSPWFWSPESRLPSTTWPEICCTPTPTPAAESWPGPCSSWYMLRTWECQNAVQRADLTILSCHFPTEETYITCTLSVLFLMSFRQKQPPPVKKPSRVFCHGCRRWRKHE